jgi:hypothetical protein
VPLARIAAYDGAVGIEDWEQDDTTEQIIAPWAPTG